MKLVNNLMIFMIGLMMVLLVTSPLIALSDDDETTDNDATDSETDHEDEEDEEDEHEKAEREVEIEIEKFQVEIESTLKNGDTKDEFEVDIDVSEDANIELEYKSENASLEIETEMEVRFFSILEYVDEDFDGVYTAANDTLIQEYVMSDISYEELTYETFDIGNSTDHVITAITTDGVFSFVTHITESFIQLNGTNVKPTGVKIDIIIDGFPYMANDSQLALYTEVESVLEAIEYDEDSPDEDDATASHSEQAITSLSNETSAFFSWVSIANADGVIADVKSSYEEVTVKEQALYLNYPRGDLIVHDPKVGIDVKFEPIDVIVDDTTTPATEPSENLDDSTLSFQTGLFFVSFFAISLIMMRRKRA